MFASPNRYFTENSLWVFRLSRVLLDLCKSILSRALKFVSVQSSQGNLSLFEITRASLLFSRKFQMQMNVLYESYNFFVSSLRHSFESETLRFPFFYKKKGLTQGANPFNGAYNVYDGQYRGGSRGRVQGVRRPPPPPPPLR